MTNDEEADEIIRRLKAPPPARWTMEKTTVTAGPRKLTANWTVAPCEEVDYIDYDDRVIEEITQALIEEIIGKPETPKIEVVHGLVNVIEDGAFLEELHSALKNDRRGR